MWTTEQQAVIDNRKSNLLVSAAAGSGKTAVLIERIIQLILDKENAINIDELLVVTFTKAAASEMRERVGNAIEEALEKNSDDKHLQKQMMLLNKADICTIDSFCGNVLKNNFHLTDLDSNIKVADPTEIEIIASEVMEDLFESLYEEDDEEFLRLVEWYSGKTNDDSLVNMILTVNNFVNSSPYPEKWLDDSAKFFDTEDKDDKFYIEKYLVPTIKDTIMDIDYSKDILVEMIEEISYLEELYPYIEMINTTVKYAEEINLKLREMINLCETKDYSSDIFIEEMKIVQNLIDEYKKIKEKQKPPAARKGVFSEETLKVYRDVKKEIAPIEGSVEESCDKLINLNVDYIVEENKILYPYMLAISNICKKFRNRFSEKKKYMGVVDFADVEHYALDILTDEKDGKIVPSEVALNYREMYVEVFTDEYQDSNYVQELILSMVSREDIPNRFMVGDVKQSIYRFRQAMPEIFMEKYENYDHYIEKPDSNNKKIMLYANFRSRAEVLEGCNHVFSSIMRKETGELDYTKEERLNPQAKFEELNDENANIGGPVEVYILSEEKKEGKSEDDELDDLESFSKQSVYIANIIYKMVNPEKNSKQYMVFDKKLNEYRPVQYRDIVILMRAPGTKAIELEEIMAYYDIPVYSEAGVGYFSTIEVDTMVNLLKIIDNPIQDIPLISVMRSPIFGFSPSELAKIRLVKKNKRFYEAVENLYNNKIYDDESEEDVDLPEDIMEIRAKVVKFIDTIDEFRRKSLLMSVDEFIWYLLRETGYYTYVGMLEMGVQRQNNLMLLFERARQYEKSSYKGIFNFINYIDRMKSRDSDLGEAKSMSEESNVVRVMSIHKSKGLEFPVVIVANSEKRFNKSLGDSNISLHQIMGYGPKVLDNLKKVQFDSFTKKMVDRTKNREIVAEEMRLLYVAMTRAKEKLVFVGKIGEKEKQIDKWKKTPKNSELNIDSKAVISAQNYLDWIMPTIVNLEERESYINLRGEEKIYKVYKDCKWGINIDDYEDIKKEYQDIMKHKSDLERTETEKEDSEIDEKESLDDVKSVVNQDDNNSSGVTEYADEKKENRCICDEIENRVMTEQDLERLRSVESKLDKKFKSKYKFESSENKPSSISVSEIKKMLNQDSEEEEKNSSIFEKKYSDDMKIPEFLHKGEEKIEFSAAERGTLFHLAMQLLDFPAFKNKEDDKDIENEIESQIESIVKRNIMTDEEANTININWIKRFIKSDIFKIILKADEEERLYKEKAINYSININRVYKDEDIDDSERMMMVGIIDLFFEDEDGNLVLMDYKTDFVPDNNYEMIEERYKVQLQMYKEAMENISGKKVKKVYLYMFSKGKLLDIEI